MAKRRTRAKQGGGEREARASSVGLAVPDEGLPVIIIDLVPELTLADSQAVRELVRRQIEALAGRAFTILMDTRAVQSVEEGSLAQLQQVEMEAAGLGLERVAHVVRFPEMQERLAAIYRDLGYPNLYGTFTDRGAAFRFLHG